MVADVRDYVAVYAALQAAHRELKQLVLENEELKRDVSDLEMIIDDLTVDADDFFVY